MFGENNGYDDDDDDGIANTIVVESKFRTVNDRIYPSQTVHHRRNKHKLTTNRINVQSEPAPSPYAYANYVGPASPDFSIVPTTARSPRLGRNADDLWSDTEVDITRILYVLAYGLGTGFSDSLSTSRDTLWIIITFSVILVVITFIKKYLRGQILRSRNDVYTRLDDLSNGDMHNDDDTTVETENNRIESEWVTEARAALDFADAIVLWFLGTTISGWIARSDIVATAHPAQLGLIPLVIVILFTIIRRVFHDNEVYINRRD